MHSVIILIKLILNKDKNHYYYKMFSEKCSYELAKKQSPFFFHSIIMLRFGETNVTKESFYAAKRPTEIWDVNIDNIISSKFCS